MEINKIKYFGEAAASYLIEKCKATFALITHKHTAEEVGADPAGSASASLALANEYTDEQLATITTGDVVVKESEHSSAADTATNAENAVNAEHATSADTATSAESATKAEQDGNGNVIADTYALLGHNHDISNVTDLQNTLDEINESINDKSQVQMVTSESSDILSTLKIHRLTQDEYEQVVENGELDEHTIYLTPDEEIDLTPYATVERLNEKADLEHNHDSLYDVKGAAEASLLSAKEYSDSGDVTTFEAAKQYTDSAVATKSQIQFITWEVDD